MEETPVEDTYWSKIKNCFYWLASDDAVPYVDVSIFLGSCIVLFLTMEVCQLCVFVLMLFSLFFCCRFRYMFFILWASIGVLWIHGWRFGNGKGFSVQWN
jgi:hypothetical protein